MFKELTIFDIIYSILNKKRVDFSDENVKKVYSKILINRFLSYIRQKNIVNILNNYINPITNYLTDEEHFLLLHQLLPYMGSTKIEYLKKETINQFNRDSEWLEYKIKYSLTDTEADIFRKLSQKQNFI